MLRSAAIAACSVKDKERHFTLPGKGGAHRGHYNTSSYFIQNQPIGRYRRYRSGSRDCTAVSAFNYNQILLRCGQGDASALTTLFNHESAVMLSLAQQVLGDTAQAQQALHDVFVMVWKHADHFDPGSGSARAWIYSILRYRLMRERRQNPPMSDAAQAKTLRQWLDEQHRMLHDDLNDGLAQSDPQAIDALGLAYFKGLDASAISWLLELPESDVRQLLCQALVKLDTRGAA